MWDKVEFETVGAGRRFTDKGAGHSTRRNGVAEVGGRLTESNGPSSMHTPGICICKWHAGDGTSITVMTLQLEVDLVNTSVELVNLQDLFRTPNFQPQSYLRMFTATINTERRITP